ncbi:plasmid pRiA4b ORF-3 family protein [Litoribacter alkaliphilus]|uniref:Plasmid pRiA4b ORF-3 family protein n=1 Tax=Litoribacter ruber TaxID=702568 RepID=A0AAP2CIB7_9BACT|nr:plasmid pRiA4b ORF-3 family protein [Litoribacter alkaliphilus]MBS9525241.1 plasmid pRiA4b ORF-3 family protein [Litoribacter alkaliphilus]
MTARIISIQPDFYKLKISLEHMPVPVFRTVLVPDNVTMERLHEIIQYIMPWDDIHFYLFSDKRDHPKYKTGRVDHCKVDNEIDDAENTLLKEEFFIKRNAAPFWYLYDLGDEWFHEITFEKLTLSDRKAYEGSPVLLEAVGNCPPEDIGGPAGYQYFLTVINDPNHPEFHSMREWLDWEKDDTDPWDVNEVNMKMLRDFLEDYDL